MATSDLERDDPICSLCDSIGVDWFRGSELDVLSRYLEAAEYFDADPVMRVTADCPLIDPGVLKGLIRAYHANPGHFITNNLEPSFPHGLDAEVFPLALLRQAAEQEGDDYDAEHVTGWMRRQPGALNLKYEIDLSHIRLTLDTRDDLTQGILDELEQSAKVDRRELVDEYARLRDQVKARDREIQGLRLKLATAGAGSAAEADQAEVRGAILWTPLFEGLDRRAHAAVVDEFRNRNRDRRFALVSTAVAPDGVSVIAAVSSPLARSLGAPELMKRLGLRGGGRPDFAQGGGVAPEDVDRLRHKARELLRGMKEEAPLD